VDSKCSSENNHRQNSVDVSIPLNTLSFLPQDAHILSGVIAINVTCKQWKLNRPKSITKIRKDKENATTYIFFDFECTQDDKFECAEGFVFLQKQENV
jgi:hypothetical protein